MNSFEKQYTGGEQPENKEKELTPKERFEGVVKNFEAVLVSKKKSSKKIQDFRNLDQGNQALVLENFKTLTLGAIKEKAIEETRAEIAEAGFAGKIWHGIAKNYYTARAEKVTAENMLSGGIGMHRDALSELCRQAKESDS